MENIRRTLAENMRAYRKDAGLTQGQLADVCGLHRTYIGGIEQERINVSLNNITKIARALGISPADLLAEQNDQSGVLRDALAGKGPLEDYALCGFSGDEVEIQPLSMEDPELGIQILVSLIQEGVTDEAELARRYKETERTLLRYLRANKP